jgi:hypothetical protein
LEVLRTDGVLAIALLSTDFNAASDYITISNCWEGQIPDQPAVVLASGLLKILQQ